jgi:hypothetical protein
MNALKLLPAIALLLAYSLPSTGHAVTRPAGKTMSVSETKNFKITEIEVSTRNGAVSDEIIAKVKDHLTRKIDKCATGNRPVKLTIRLDNYKGISAGALMLLGDYVQFSGLITFFDQDGTRLAEYYNDEFRFGGGLIGAAILSSVVSNFPQQFVQSMCEAVFAVELPDDPTPKTPENYENN